MPGYASLGYVGYVKIDGDAVIRATSCDIKASQQVDAPNLVDGKMDKTVYQLHPIEIGGSVAFPAVHEATSGSSTIMKKLWQKACIRGVSDGKLQKIAEINTRYNDVTAYKYLNCIVDTFEFSVAQSDMANVTIGVIGTDRAPGFLGYPSSFYGFRNTRAVTWNDAVARFVGSVSVLGEEIRSFTFNLNNNSQRFYTLNGKLRPQDIAPGKRDLSGSVTIMGRNSSLAEYAYSNQSRCTETSAVEWGYSIGVGTTGSCSGDLLIRVPGIVFQIEEIALTNELLETTVNYKALPGIAYQGEDNTTDFVV